MKKVIVLFLVIGIFLSGCAVQKQIEINNALARIAGRNLGYRTEQAKAMVQTQIIANPVMTADMLDLITALTPTTGLFNTALDQAAAEGFQNGSPSRTASIAAAESASGTRNRNAPPVRGLNGPDATNVPAAFSSRR